MLFIYAMLLVTVCFDFSETFGTEIRYHFGYGPLTGGDTDSVRTPHKTIVTLQGHAIVH